MAEFLSDAWLRALDAAVQEAVPDPTTDAFVVEQVVRDVPGRDLVRYCVEVGPAGARVGPAPAGLPRVRLTTDYATAVAIARGEENGQAALAAGRLRLGGDVEVLARAAAALATLAGATAGLRSATTYRTP